MLNFKYSSIVLMLVFAILFFEFIPNRSLALQCTQVFKVRDNQNIEFKLINELNQLINHIQNEQKEEIKVTLQNKFYTLFNEANEKLGKNRAAELFKQLNFKNKAAEQNQIKRKSLSNSKTSLEVANAHFKVFTLDWGHIFKTQNDELYYFGNATNIPDFSKVKSLLSKNEKIVDIYELKNKYTIIYQLNTQKLIIANTFKIVKVTPLYPKSKIKQIINSIILYENGKIQIPFVVNNKREFEYYQHYLLKLTQTHIDIFQIINTVGNDYIFISKDGSIYQFDYIDNKVTVKKTKVLNQGEKFVRIITSIANDSNLIIETNKQNYYGFSTTKNSYGEKGIDITKLDSIKTLASSQFHTVFLSSDAQINIYGYNIGTNYAKYLTNELSFITQSLMINNEFIFARTDKHQYRVSKIIRQTDENRNMNRKPNLITIDQVHQIYTNKEQAIVQFLDGKLALLNSSSELIPIPLNFKVKDIIPLEDKGFILTCNTNIFYYVSNNGYSHVLSLDNEFIYTKNQHLKVINYFPNNNILIIQYENGHFESLLKPNRDNIMYEAEEYKKYQHYIDNLEPINLGVDEAVFNEKSKID